MGSRRPCLLMRASNACQGEPDVTLLDVSCMHTLKPAIDFWMYDIQLQSGASVSPSMPGKERTPKPHVMCAVPHVTARSLHACCTMHSALRVLRSSGHLNVGGQLVVHATAFDGLSQVCRRSSQNGLPAHVVMPRDGTRWQTLIWHCIALAGKDCGARLT